MTDKILENIIITIIVFLGSFLIFSFAVNYDNSVKCETKNGNWYFGKCLSKSDNIEIEI